MFDVTFLTSNWTCIFGNGCQGVLTGPAPELVQGCCSYGAHLVDKKDARRVEKAAATLTPEEWQYHGTKKNVIHVEQARRDGHPGRRRRLHLLEPARLPGRGGMRLSHRGDQSWRRSPDLEARGVLAASAAARGPGRRRRRPRHLGHPPMGPPSLGQRRPRVPLVVHRGTRRLRRLQARVRGDAGRAHQDGRPKGLRPLRGSRARARRAAQQRGGAAASRRADPQPRPARKPVRSRASAATPFRSASPSADRRRRRGTWTSAWIRGCGRTGPLRRGTTTRARRPVRPRTRRTAPSTRSKTASGCALPRSADGVLFSRELLVTPGPHFRVPAPYGHAVRTMSTARPV